MEQRTMSLEIRSADIENRKLVGYAAIFREEYTQLRDRWGDVFYERVRPGAFKKSLAERAVCMLVNHDWSKIVGRTGSNLILEEDDKGLRFELDIPNTTDGNDLLENVRNGLIQGCSFGFNIKNQTTRWDDNGAFYRDIDEVELFEVTATPIPAYVDTEISARSQLSIRDIKPIGPKANQEEKENKYERSAMLMSAFFNAFIQN
ncbi:HK97 family phage prohead protease [Turicibacter sanguinis]|nr:HK97 family phage prohead protease [Turicibacter sanguinis]